PSRAKREPGHQGDIEDPVDSRAKLRIASALPERSPVLHRRQQRVVETPHLALLRKRAANVAEQEAGSEEESKTKAGESAHIDLLTPPRSRWKFSRPHTASTFLLALNRHISSRCRR